MKNSLLKLALLPLCLTTLTVSAQQLGVKTNVLYWATTTPNLAVEAAVTSRITVQLSGSYNPFRFSDKAENKKLWHMTLQGEGKYWMDEAFNGFFVGFHAHYLKYNASGIKFPLGLFPELKDSRFEGYGVGAGFSAGYQWYLGKNWNLEATLGVGYTYISYDQYECKRCGSFREHGNKHWYGPTKASVSFIYLIKSKNPSFTGSRY